jgi:two-component system response regulator YesN
VRLYRLIIVDDEEDIRDGLGEIIDWKKMGFSLVGKFEDAIDALKYIKENPVDIVLTDVNMAHMSGLELAKKISEDYPNIKVVILSGYKQFKYVKEAMYYNVISYLLKPTNLDEVEETFSKIKVNLDYEISQREKSTYLESKLEQTIDYIYDDFFNKLFNGDFSEHHLELSKKLELAEIDINPHCPCSIYSVNDLGENQSMIQTINKYFKKAILNFSLYPITNNNAIKVMVFVRSNCRCDEVNVSGINVYIDSVRLKIKNLFNIELSIKLDNNYDSIFALADNIASESAFNSNDISKNSELILNAKKYIDENYFNEITLYDVANFIHISGEYLSRLFKKETGDNFIEYLKKVRINQAMELLKDRNSKLDDVCFKVGYKSTKYFVKIFSQYSGMSISEYRKKCKNERL